VESHHGSDVAIPNSWQSIIAGYAEGADLIEVDVQASADGVLFLLHHYTIRPRVWVSETPFEQLSEMVTTRNGQELVLLRDFLRWIGPTGLVAVLDVKTGFRDQAGLVQAVIKEVSDSNMEHSTVVSDWDHTTSLLVKQLNDSIATRAAIRGRVVDFADLVERAEADILHVEWDVIRAVDIESLHSAGVLVSVTEGWDDSFLDRTLPTGVDIVATGRPGRLRRAMAGSGSDVLSSHSRETTAD
jgi:glycerophosphoryl diester phosphodiesterase